MDFSTFKLSQELLSGIHDMGYTRPTPVQEKAIPPILEGRDVAGCAQTGTGKTAAYLLPIVDKLLPKPRGTTRCLILSPTRELAIQVDEQLVALAYHTAVRGAAIYGGVPMHPQEAALRAGVEIVTATPGRLLDHLRYDYLSLKTIEILVLDEADRMLDMGFLPDLQRIISHLPEKRQNLLFSATLEADVLRLARQILHDPVRVQIGKVAPASGITHAVYPVPQNRKTDLLQALLRRTQIPSGLVFTRTRERASSLARVLRAQRLGVGLIHSGLDQPQRIDSLNRFRRGQVQLLVATDVASRGLDIEGISHVINYDVPRSPDDYIHRCGRTARAEAYGEALTFVSPEERRDLQAIERAIGRPLPRVRLPGFDHPEQSAPPPPGRRARSGAGHRGRRRGRKPGAGGARAPAGSSGGGPGPRRPRRRRRRKSADTGG
jgi:ATP-dependent RNA helicase RhlE